jgi:subtilisin family serine protease
LARAALALVLPLFLALPSPSMAQQAGDASARILWRDFSFDTTKAAPEFASDLSFSGAELLEAEYYFVQFTGPITEAMKKQVTDAGAGLMQYVPENAYLVRMEPGVRATVEGLSSVRWVGVYQPGMRVSPRLLRAPEASAPAIGGPTPGERQLVAPDTLPAAGDARVALTIIAFRGADLAPIETAVRGAGGEILSAGEGARRSKLRVVLPRDRIGAIARINGVMWIEELLPYRLHNDMSRGVLDVGPLWSGHGLRGEGQIIAVADSGLDSGLNDASMHDDMEGRIVNIFSWPVQNTNYCSIGVCIPLNVGADDTASDLDSGHGTHTTGSAVGNGASSGGTYSGVAPGATLVFQAIEQFVDLPLIGGKDYDAYMLGGIPADLNDLYQQAYDAGARIHSNSWGLADAGNYSDNAFETDEFVRDHPDMLILRSAGNAGEDADGNSVIETGSVGSPGTAKNALTLGASENNRPGVPLTWSKGYGPVIDADLVADNSAGMAPFSSRGPANADTAAAADDRIKPDLVAPGTMVVSTRSQASPNTEWFADDMESGVNGWTAAGTWAQVTTESHSATHSWHDSPGGDYADNANIALTSPVINLSGGGLGAKAIRCWLRYDLGAGDVLRVEVSKDGGANWIGLDLTGEEADWDFWTLGLDGFPDYYNSANFRLRFRLNADGDGNTGDGFYVDDVQIVEGAFFTARLSDLGLAAAGSADDQNYLLMNGTSMSTPLAAGAAAIVRQYYTQELGLPYVSAALLRATLINGATDISPGQYGVGATREIVERPNNVEGWGRLNLENSLYPAAPAVLDHVDELAGLDAGETHDYALTITDAGAPVVVTMVYHDSPGAALVNNLDMTVIAPAPGGATEYPNGLATTDTRNNVEQIVIPAPVLGTYTVRVHGQNVPEGPQPYALVTSAGGTLSKRDPVDMALALDLSGSMLSPACPTCEPKLDVLKDAVEIFAALWTAVAVPDDMTALNYFRTTIDEFQVGGAYLVPFLSNATALVADVRAQTTTLSNLTAMGGSLQTAIGRLPDAGRPRNIILFTDGMQNVNPMVIDTDPTATGFDLVIDDEPGRTSSGISPTSPPTALDAALGIKVNAIGVGAAPAFIDLLNAIADETGGVSKLTNAPDEDLRRFFVEQLIDALRYHSPQLLDYRPGAVGRSGATETFQVNSSPRKVILKLSWKRGAKVSFRPAKDGIDLSRYGQVIAGDFYRMQVFDVPFTTDRGVIEAAGDWTMHIAGAAGARYEAAMVVDETALDYTVAILGQDNVVGDPLELAVELKAGGKPVIDAGEVQARVLAPRIGLGNLLAETPLRQPAMRGIAGVESTTATTATTAAAPEAAAATPGQTKLLALMRDPDFFDKARPVARIITLTHQGGGRYTGAFGATARPGIYTVEFTAEGEHPGVGRYHRTETLSTLVRFGKADVDASEIDLRKLDDPVGDWNARLTVRPKDRLGNYLGPDYGHVLAVDVGEPAAASQEWRDLADGRYEMLVRIPDGADPVVGLRVWDQVLYDGPASALKYRLAKVLWWVWVLAVLLIFIAMILGLINRSTSP